ncbi:hypothetical protein DBR32_06395 [Taibaiella sp. KBW10]|uniref:hypothetical protein n=1 Tax=Taibaiella sp. KBW10 TaxID=2153357 RepID=UPI000F5A2652|nr:hypothetical protein [Taibaiella sp. KBW10]RQO31583.1 hypothetical protein DBR32_06395 [Taibaiella sp. KBW10]
MKKFLTILLVLIFSITGLYAQSTTATSKKAAKKETQSTTSGTKLKADGTPDMRYKENQTKTKPAAGPTKKDGTADMRYKANKKGK